jgi:pimeloyl-ACP methyl ester carboxylesterase
MPFITYKNKSLHYRIKTPNHRGNEDQALILIHGSGENSNVWKNQFEDLDLSISLITVDLPSHGDSDYIEAETLSLDFYVDSIKTLKEELNLKSVALGGHSLGGAIIQSYYFHYPEDVIGLILISTGGRLRVSPRILNHVKNDFDQFINTISVASFYRKTPEDLIEPYIEEISKVEQEVIHKDFKICDEFDILDKVGEIKVPCLILVGKADKLTPVKYQKYFDKYIDDSKLVIINKAGHSVMLEQPSEINNEIEGFLESIL